MSGIGRVIKQDALIRKNDRRFKVLETSGIAPDLILNRHVMSPHHHPGLDTNDVDIDTLSSNIEESCSVSQLAGLRQNPASLPILSSAFLILDRRIIFKLIREQMIDDAGELVCDRGNGFRRAEACLHSAEVLPEACLALV